jgi:hypothetical protein
MKSTLGILLVAAAFTFPASSWADTASTSSPRLGYIAPTANRSLMQPVLDRYANDIRQRVADATPISVKLREIQTGLPARLGSIDPYRRHARGERTMTATKARKCL